MPFADNWGGDLFCLDLHPGPKGTVGQVICVWHEDQVGATLVADSLTDFLAGRWHTPRGRRAPKGLAAMIHHSSGVVPADLTGLDSLQILQVGSVREPVDLAPCLGLPAVRTLRASRLADPDQVLTYPALEYLSLNAGNWRTLLDAGTLPAGLAALGVEDDGNLIDEMDVLGRLAAHYGVPAPGDGRETFEGSLA